MGAKVIVSALVDSQILSYFPEMDIRLFKTLEELDAYVADNPLRVEDLIVTQDVTRDSPNRMFTLLSNICVSTFFRSEQLIYVTPPNSRGCRLVWDDNFSSDDEDFDIGALVDKFNEIKLLHRYIPDAAHEEWLNESADNKREC